MDKASVVEELTSRIRSGDPKVLVVDADEAAGWPPGTLDGLLSDGFVREIEPASSVVCDQCIEGHVELVDFVEEPAGSPKRAYISCAEAGRVAVDTQRMRRWQIVAQLQPKDGRREEKAGSPELAWPPTAAAFVSILRQAHSAGAAVLRWAQIKERLAVLGHHPNRARDVRRNVADWDDVVESPRRGFYRLKA